MTTVILIIVASALAGNSTPIPIAQATTPIEAAPQILQFGALGVLALTLWIMLTKTFPAEKAATKEQRESFLSFLQTEREQNREFILQIVDRIPDSK